MKIEVDWMCFSRIIINYQDRFDKTYSVVRCLTTRHINFFPMPGNWTYR